MVGRIYIGLSVGVLKQRIVCFVGTYIMNDERRGFVVGGRHGHIRREELVGTQH